MEVSVRLNDSMWYFSQLFDIPLIVIERSNQQVSPDQLMIGQRIQIPGFTLNEYIIEENDTLWNIAMQRNLPLDALLLVNQNIDTSSLNIGQSIVVPSRITNMLVNDVDQYTYQKMQNDIQRLLEVYPFIVNQSIGNSVMGKNITELQIGTGSKQVHINGSFHANEWITTPVIMRFLNQYALSITKNMSIRGLSMLPLYMDTLLSVVPMVNPDGVDLVINGSSAADGYQEQVLAINDQNEDFSNWKANINGVDLNNQYPALWDIEAQRKPTTPQPRDYPGPRPLSEPESIAMADLARQRNFVRMNAFHTQGEVIFWGFQGLEPPFSETIVNEYTRVSGYRSVRYVDSFAGYKDWFIQEFQNPGFTVELGSGVNPLPIEQFPEIYEETLGIMLANLYL
ncbi:M14 family metallopeptidase [Virgibacillus byunsanensis]|uniref:M14 family metallopeptidase n=1 Tax=Virgibacillus byunsanensis TaxID=570945 RepID=A0ABW3LNP9_9BACI